LFGRETREDMEIIRRVRNLFAHQSAVMTFKLPEIEETCQHLSIVRDRTIADARGRYCAACIAIANRIQSGVIRRTTKWDPSWAHVFTAEVHKAVVDYPGLRVPPHACWAGAGWL